MFFLFFLTTALSFPDVLILSQNDTSGYYGIDRLSFADKKGETVAHLSNVLNSDSFTPYLTQDSASNCNAISSNGADWHFVTSTDENEVALLSVDVRAKNNAKVRKVSPSITANETMPIGCVWYDETGEIVMLRFSNLNGGATRYNIDAIDVQSGKVRAVAWWDDGGGSVSLSLTAIDKAGRLLLPNTDIGGDSLLLVDASVNNKTLADALVANATISVDGFAVGVAGDDTLFLTFPPNSDGSTSSFGSASSAALLKGGKAPVNVTTPSSWSITNPGGAQVVDDTTVFYSSGSGTWGPDASAFFVFCTVKLPLSHAPKCTNSSLVKKMVWSAVVVPDGGVTPGTIVGIVVGSLVGVALCIAGIVWYRRRAGRNDGYTRVN